MKNDKLLAEIERLPFKLEHIEKYVRQHETDHYGTFIIAHVKEEFCDRWNYECTTKVKEGLYPYQATFKILGKEYAYFRKKLKKIMSKSEYYKVTKHGINPGTPIARSVTITGYEIDGAKVIKLLR